MFDKDGEMKTAKSAGSPAFMPPELCVPKHGHVSGRAADIWSMGCTLFCLLFGRIPFEKHGMIELYQAIRVDEPVYDESCSDELRILLQRLLEKDPQKRITIEELRVSRFPNISISWLTRAAGTPVGHATRIGSFAAKIRKCCYHHRTAYRRRSKCRHHRQHGTSRDGGKCARHIS
jgi:serine/threonine protein kinase